jgi:putative phosphoribosyl transferase
VSNVPLHHVPVSEEQIEVPLRGARIRGELAQPADVKGLVVFAHGSGSGRYSPRNKQVARYLNEVGLATALIDLLTDDEQSLDARDRRLRFDIGLLSGRVLAVTHWLAGRPGLGSLPFGYFGASTGAAAALVAAGELGDAYPGAGLRAVVSRGGRPDLAAGLLGRVRAPTLLIVGELDEQVIELNKQAAEHLVCRHRLEVVRGATHLFEEPGALEQVADLAAGWFEKYLIGSNPQVTPK